MNPLLLSGLFDVVGKVADRLWPDQEKKAQAQMEILRMQASGELQLALAQIEVNKTEAANGSAYAKGWRPTIGYICAAALAYQYLARPLLIGLGGFAALPSLDGSLFDLVFGMLGLAGLRTYEKTK